MFLQIVKPENVVTGQRGTCIVISCVSFHVEQDIRTMTIYVTATVACQSLHVWFAKTPNVITP